jgi:hypothetical protein
MERERTATIPAGPGGGPEVGSGTAIADVRANLDGILAEADRILDSLPTTNAEEYLQLNRQRGGQ